MTVVVFWHQGLMPGCWSEVVDASTTWWGKDTEAVPTVDEFNPTADMASSLEVDGLTGLPSPTAASTVVVVVSAGGGVATIITAIIVTVAVIVVVVTLTPVRFLAAIVVVVAAL